MRLVAFVSLLLLSPVLAADSARIEYFDGGAGLLTLSPVPSTNGFKVSLKGTSVHPNLMLQVQKTGGSTVRKYLINLSSGKFSCVVLMKDGPGEYKFTFFGSPSPDRGKANYSGLCFFAISSRGSVPASFPGLVLDGRISAEAGKYLGKTVGRGECWDLAQKVLDDLGADWQRPVQFGRRVDWNKEAVEPGDIMQMYSLKLVYADRIEYFGLPQHTAIVSRVLAPGVYELLHQNVAGKRFVVKGQINLKVISGGTLEVYRPLAGIVYSATR